MKKIGIITILKCNNFGAELQAFATQYVLRQMGYDAEIIDYLYFKHPKFKYTKNAKTTWKRDFKTELKEYLKYQIAGKLLSSVVSLFVKKQRKLSYKFDAFHNDNTKLSKTYRSIDELYKASMNYDVYIVGSDQVWNPGTGANLAPYFLTFAPKGKKTISYASSFGVSKIPESISEAYKSWINNIDYLSVREDAGVKIINELTGRKATLVLDPTLLLNRKDWVELKGGEFPQKGYVLIYETYRSEKLYRMASYYAEKNHVKIYRVETKAFFNKKDDQIVNLEECGPADFVKLIENAGLVLTGSFHGTAFSVNMGVPFYSVLKRDRNNNSRITSLLHKLDLENRIIYEDDPFDKINWDAYDVEKSQKLLQIEREKSLAYLKKSIDD